MYLNGEPCVYPPVRKPERLIDPTHFNAIKELLRSYDTYLEIGAYDGATVSELATIYPQKQFFAIDSFTDNGRSGLGCLQYFLTNNKDKPNVHLYVGVSQAILPVWLREKRTFGFILVDGDHSFRGAFQDMCLAWNMVEDGGMMLCHDVGATHMGVGQAVEAFTALTGQKMTRKIGVDIFVKEWGV